MKKSLLEIYSLAVCFFTVACFVVVLGIALWDAVQLSVPEFTLDSDTYEAHQTDEAFRDHLIKQYRPDEVQKTYKPPEGAALSEAREKSFAAEIRSERRDALQGLVQNLIILLIDLVVFIAHWKVGAYARKSAG